MTEDPLQLLLDRSEIERVVYDYALGLDTKDWTLWRSIFTDDVRVKFRPAAEMSFVGLGQDWVPMTADDWVGHCRTLFSGLATTQHQMSNPQVTIDGQNATCVTYAAGIRSARRRPMRAQVADAVLASEGAA